MHHCGPDTAAREWREAAKTPLILKLAFWHEQCRRTRLLRRSGEQSASFHDEMISEVAREADGKTGRPSRARQVVVDGGGAYSQLTP